MKGGGLHLRRPTGPSRYLPRDFSPAQAAEAVQTEVDPFASPNVIGMWNADLSAGRCIRPVPPLSALRFGIREIPSGYGGFLRRWAAPAGAGHLVTGEVPGDFGCGYRGSRHRHRRGAEALVEDDLYNPRSVDIRELTANPPQDKLRISFSTAADVPDAHASHRTPPVPSPAARARSGLS